MYLLGYDIGSSSVKASLVNAETGKCAATAFYPKSEAPILSKKQIKSVTMETSLLVVPEKG